MPKPKSVIIIGAGIAGLSAGCYAGMNGFKTRIFEMHTLPGGVCTAWRRKGYTFDGCLDWLVGSSPRSGFHRVWRELGAFKDSQVINHESFLRYEDKDGRAVEFYTDADRLERHLLEIAPEDKEAIKELTGAIRKLRLEMPDGGGIRTIWSGLRMLPAIGVMRRFSPLSVEEYARRFKSGLMREAIGSYAGSLPDFSAMAVIVPLALQHHGDGGYIAGGSLEFARAIEWRYLGLGGELSHGSRVAKILVEKDRAAGVRLENGQEYRADYVISAADGHATIFEMLEGRYLDDRIRGFYQGGLTPFPPIVQVSLGVARDFSDLAKVVHFALDRPLEIAGQKHHSLGVKHFAYDPSVAPAGRTALTTTIMTDYDYWCQLAQAVPRFPCEGRGRSLSEVPSAGKGFGVR